MRLPAQRGYDEEWLGGTFSQAVFVGNGLMAIMSGFLAHTLVELLALGPVAPFDAAHAVLLLGGIVILATWTENFGDEVREQNPSLLTQISTALRAIRRGELSYITPDTHPVWLDHSPFGARELQCSRTDCAYVRGKNNQRGVTKPCMHSKLYELREACSADKQLVCADRKIALLGAIQSLFEASMYTFVFLWTPALSPNGEKVAHGMIFACFMMSCMAGSTIAGRLLADSKRHSVSHYMKVRAYHLARERLPVLNLLDSKS